LENSSNPPSQEQAATPKEIKYSDIEDIVEYLVSTKSHSFSFDVYGADDIGQEIRIICFKALQHFDTARIEKERWTNFFGRCVDNGLKNLKRDNYIRPATPCPPECSFLHGEEYLTDQIDGVCKRWLGQKEKIQKRISVIHPVNIESIGDIIRDGKEDKEAVYRDLKNYLLEKLAPELHGPFNEMLEGRGSKLTLNQRRKVQKAVKGLLNTKNDEEQ
jgi:hypothetical protein